MAARGGAVVWFASEGLPSAFCGEAAPSPSLGESRRAAYSLTRITPFAPRSAWEKSWLTKVYVPGSVNTISTNPP